MIGRINRRAFLKSAGAGSSLLVSAGLMAQDGGTANPTLRNPSDLESAEKILGLSYTSEERRQIYDGLEALVDRVKLRRSQVPLSNSDAPAQIFDPRLKGEVYKVQGNSLEIIGGEVGPLPSDEAIAFAPIWKQARWIRQGLLTSMRLTDIYMQRIRAHGDKLECFITLMNQTALAEAYRADTELRSGKDLGLLHGIPYGLKDLADTKGVRTSWGATPYKDRVPEEDAVIVKRLRAAGAVLVGKTALGALAYGDLWFNGMTKNPWDMDEGSSGSSAGSAAATAAGLCSFAIGSETMGSIISPSARCGTTGLRPTFGRVARTGCMTLCWSLDKLGPITRSVEDAAAVLHALNGADAEDPSSMDWGFAYDGMAAMAEDIRIGYDPLWFADASASEKAVLPHLKEMGFTLTQISLPDLPYSTLFTTLDVEAAAAFEALTLSNQDDELRWQESQAWPNSMRTSHFISAVEALQVDRFRRKVMAMMAEVYRGVDVIVCPNFSGNMLEITNFTGSPSLTLPVGLENRKSRPRLDSPDPMPYDQETPHPQTITLWGNLFREDQILAVGRLLEQKARFYELYKPDLGA